MRVSRKRKAGVDIADSGALSDLAFLLIIFFIVIAVFNVNLGFILGLPRPDSTKVVNTEDLVRATLAADGSLAADGERVTAAELEQLLTERLAVRPNMTLLLAIDPETPYQRVVDVVQVVRTTGVERFSFQMEENA
jgi:biopolymer transport protein ExbD